jgi:hypothetical protein
VTRLLTDEELPEGFRYAAAFLQMMSHPEPADPDPWWCLVDTPERPRKWLKMAREDYPSRVLIPFAKYESYEEAACFDGTDRSGDPKVHIVHFGASPGQEHAGSFANFDAWLDQAKRDAAEWKAEREADEDEADEE